MFDLPSDAIEIIKKLQLAGHQAYLVGGSIRDLLLNLAVAEWDITTSAKPEEVKALFDKVIPTGLEFGTVTIILNSRQYEVTTFRRDEKYLDARHPSRVVFTDRLEQDLGRRDFTVNALAYEPTTGKLIDKFSGLKDLKNKIIRAIGRPLDRFREDGLRPLRACRLAAKLGFKIHWLTKWGIRWTLKTAAQVAPERARDELVKLLKTAQPSIGFELMRQTGLLKLFLPELLACRGVKQPPNYHPYDVYYHSLYSCDAAPADNLAVRLAALFHDLGKPACKVGLTFYGHEKVSADLAKQRLRLLKFSNDDVHRVVRLVEQHMFNYESNWTDAAVRRFINRAGGLECIADLFALRLADVAAMRQPANSAYLLELRERIDKIVAASHALKVADLKINGHDVMQTLKIPPGPKVGQALAALLEQVLDDPALNEREKLLQLLIKHA